MPGIRFAEVRAHITMAQVLRLLGFVPVCVTASSVRGACPVHRSRGRRSRSFSADLERQVYRCFGCGSSGNQLDLYAAAKGLTIFVAAIELCEQLHREIPWVYRW